MLKENGTMGLTDQDRPLYGRRPRVQLLACVDGLQSLGLGQG